ncbi:MAG: tRNA (adenosine(37)-N6)-threonylcarbamoyltransferase complex transferase subunit TsaD [Devosiaceae bacterium]|nr:tRNA (adenosine(37)-N6)-threonylcarbamoyltransferase complex transferase subunit TsaD [Devosiaceae bacterium MH13]
MLALGIETSCDETAVAIVRHSGQVMGGQPAEILAETVLSQIDDHAPFGGVVPEIAARAHVDHLDRLVRQCLDQAGIGLAALDLVAATTGPGLIGGVLVGSVAGQAIASAANVPFRAVNHLEGHALSPRLAEPVAFPYLLFLVSGGHTQIVCVRAVGAYERWGSTLDDALGEAFDKTAKILDLGFPGGPAVERMAEGGDPTRFALPRPLKGKPGCDLSFAGLKTALRLAAEDTAPLSESDVRDLAASFQAAVVDSVSNRLGQALDRFAEETEDAPRLVAAGGVAANKALRAALDTLVASQGGRLIVPPAKHCTDNAAMIAWAALEREVAGLPAHPTTARPRWPLDEAAAPVLGSGKKGARA